VTSREAAPVATVRVFPPRLTVKNLRHESRLVKKRSNVSATRPSPIHRDRPGSLVEKVSLRSDIP